LCSEYLKRQLHGPEHSRIRKGRIKEEEKEEKNKNKNKNEVPLGLFGGGYKNFKPLEYFY
jgi:hypothetical protein